MATPFMNLTIPIVSTTVGPIYATEINTALTTIDSHNHTVGFGTQLPTAAIVVNADFPFNFYNQTFIRSSRYIINVSPISGSNDQQCSYAAGTNGDLYWNDGLGNQVRITASGSVNVAGSGNITGMGGTTATVTYSSISTAFTFLSNTGIPAIIACGPIAISPIASNANAITIQSPTLSASYSLTLPSALASTNTSFVVSSSSGVLSYITLGTAYQIPQVNSGGSAVTYVSQIQRSNLPTVGQQVSSSSSNFTTTSATYTAVTNLSVTITTTGRPVWVGLNSDGTASNSYIGCLANSNTSVNGTFAIFRGATNIATHEIQLTGASATIHSLIPSSALQCLDVITAGTYTYTVQVLAGSGTTVAVNDAVLIAYEL